MYHNVLSDNINATIPRVFKQVLENGREVASRNGRTLELAFTGITITDGTSREILLPGRKHNLAAQIAETMWVLAGRNDIEWLGHYLPRAKDYSDDGVTWRGGYGPRLRFWTPSADVVQDPIDQVGHVVNLLRESPATRQAVIGIYDPAIDTFPGKDIPCNDFLHFLSREGYLDLHIFVRSNDAMWGWSGINVFEWSTLLEVVAGMTGLRVGALHFSVSSFHLYEQHWDKAAKIVAGGSVAQYASSPRLDPTGLDDMDSFHHLCHEWFRAEQAIREGSSLATKWVDEFPEPMLQSWLRVLQWWWTGDAYYLRPLDGTNLSASAIVAVQPVNPADPQGLSRLYATQRRAPDTLINEIIALHNEKNAAYGDSWCKRGEMLGIMANIARKVDRLESGKSTSDETQLDTATDLFVYCAKYLAWIKNDGVPDVDMANTELRAAADLGAGCTLNVDETLASIPGAFAALEMAVVHDGKREPIIEDLMEFAWSLVRHWSNDC